MGTYSYDKDHTSGDGLTLVSGTSRQTINAIKNTANQGITNEGDAFVASTTGYKKGDLVIYKNVLYKCIHDHTGNWSAANFEATNVATELADALEWKYFGNAQGNTDSIDISSISDARELMIQIDHENNLVSTVLPIRTLTSQIRYHRFGGADGGTWNQLAIAKISKTTVQLNSNKINGTDYSTNSEIQVYYR